jgi:hypothetical protein
MNFPQIAPIKCTQIALIMPSIDKNLRDLRYSICGKQFYWRIRPGRRNRRDDVNRLQGLDSCVDLLRYITFIVHNLFNQKD